MESGTAGGTRVQDRIIIRVEEFPDNKSISEYYSVCVQQVNKHLD
jgi:hypothetical protein